MILRNCRVSVNSFYGWSIFTLIRNKIVVTYVLFYYVNRIVACFFFFLNVEILYHFLEFEASTMLITMTIRNDDWSIESNDFFLDMIETNNMFLVHRALESSTLSIVKRSIRVTWMHVRVHYRSKKNLRVINPIKVLLSWSVLIILLRFTLQFHVIHWNLFFYVL